MVHKANQSDSNNNNNNNNENKGLYEHKKNELEDEVFRVDKWKMGLFTLFGGAIACGIEFFRQLGKEKIQNHHLLTSYKPEAFDIDERSFILMKKLEKFGKIYPKQYVELVWILDVLLFREKQLMQGVPPLFSDVPESQRLVMTLDHKLKLLTVANKRWKSTDLSNATQLYQDIMDFAKYHLSNIYSLCQNVGSS